MKTRIGFVGAGQWGLIKHLPSLKLIHEDSGNPFTIQFAHLAEADENHRDKVQREWGFSRSSSSVDALANDSEIDAYVVTINPNRLGQVLPALAATGKPIFCEKPPGANLEEARRFRDAVTQTHLIAFNRRFHPLVRIMKDRLAEEPVHCFQAHMLRHGRLDSFHARTDSQALPFFQGTAIHLIDALRFLIGDWEVAHMAHLETKPGETDGRMVHCQAASGAHGSVALLPTCGRNEERIEVHCQDVSLNLSVCLDEGASSVFEVYRKRECVETYIGDPSKGSLFAHGYIGEHLEFLQAINDGRSSLSTFDNTIDSLRLSEHIENAVYIRTRQSHPR